MIFHFRLNCQWKDRSLVALDSSYDHRAHELIRYRLYCKPTTPHSVAHTPIPIISLLPRSFEWGRRHAYA
ncbi:hypothetical protein EMIT0P228_10190 [Pseudomonas brassicacearum]